MALEDLTRYQYGSLAGRLLQSKEGQMYTQGALEQLASDLGIEESAGGFIQGAMASKEGLQMAVMTYAGKYEKAMNEMTVKELYAYHKGYFEAGLDDEEKGIIDKKYASNETKVGEIREKIIKLQYQAQSPDKKDSAKAEKELKKYEDFIEMFDIIQDNLYKNLLPKAIERMNQHRLKMLAQK